MGIAATITGVAALASTASTINGMVSGGAGGAANAVGTGVGGLITAQAQQEAGDIQKAAAIEAMGKQQGINDLVMPNYNPFLGINQQSTGGISSLLGGPGMDPAAAKNFLSNTPGYQFALDQGLKGVTSNLSKDGLALSGSALKGGAAFAEGLASQQYQNMVTNFMNMGNLALSGTNSYANAAYAGQDRINNLIMARGQAEAAGKVGAGNVLGNTMANLGAQMATNNPPPLALPQNNQLYRPEMDGRFETSSYPYSVPPYQIQQTPLTPPGFDPSSLLNNLPTLPTG